MFHNHKGFNYYFVLDNFPLLALGKAMFVGFRLQK